METKWRNVAYFSYILERVNKGHKYPSLGMQDTSFSITIIHLALHFISAI